MTERLDRIINRAIARAAAARVVRDSNSKLGRINHVNLQPGPNASCDGSVPCWDCSKAVACYALKAWVQYPDVRSAWSENYVLAMHRPEVFEDAVRAALDRQSKAIKRARASCLPIGRKRYFRWHSAGDIPDQRYLDMMVRLALAFPEIIFMAFTKRLNLNFAAAPDNLQIIVSMWPGWSHPTPHPSTEALPKAWIDDGNEDRIPDNALRCPGHCDSCGMCWQLSSIGRDVAFDAH